MVYVDPKSWKEETNGGGSESEPDMARIWAQRDILL